ncbi:DUF4097 family beta strand repeat-containing protein [Micromonospora carbonacea]|uniref:DUF4097 family beta strand repeat protein n=1 Tax=Micromonospora carbonacea TaxID=47853 RepID=A0A7H8XR73_9ACTN|nr:DUF4097 family beta strand repeat-containing protein [Micromonospora carbonacea]MBB5824875.1 hypothetical protein [Micromonospora carbonacea]QLD26988.1 DUF4097 family beta strand repeat protein [Micromonospora carbonacea]
MASHRTAPATRPALPARAVAVGAAATLVLLAGCDNLSLRRLDFDDVESTRIARVTVLPGSGDVTVVGSGPAGQVRIKRVLRYHGDQPGARYEIRGDELVLDSDCGDRCSISYEVTAPEGIAVNGETGSGNVVLSRVGVVDVRLGSGNLEITRATGPVRAETDSGNVEVDDVRGPATLRAGSGNVTGSRLGGQVDAETDSGDVTVELSAPASVRAHAGSGDVQVVVPAGRYRVRSDVGTGETELGIVDDPGAPLLLDLAADSGDVAVTAR